MMGWRLTCFSLLALFSLTDSRPSLLDGGDGGHQEHHGDHGEHHQEHHGVHEVKHHEDMQFLAEPYIHQEILAEPYIHQQFEAEPYIHEEIIAEPYIHQEFEAEPYKHEDIQAEPYINKKAQGDTSLAIEAKSHVNADTVDSTTKTHTKIIKRKRVLKTSSSSVLAKSKDVTNVEDTDGDAIKNVASQTVEDLNNLIPEPYTGEIAEVEFTGPKIDPKTLKQDQSFKFSFSSSDYSRKEESDANGNVKGSYSFKNEHGEDVEVKYTAGADTGFVVENLDEVLAKSIPKESALVDTPSDVIVVESNLPQDILSSNIDIIEVISGTEESGLENEGSGISDNHEAPLPDSNEPLPVPISQPDTLYGAPSEDLPSYNEPELTVPAPLNADNEDLPSYNEPELTAPASLTGDIPVMVMNPNYKFAYNNDDSSRTEDANPDTGIITGQYSYTNPEGNEIEVKYRAGAGIGFVIDNQEELDAFVLKAVENGTPLVEPKAKADTSSSQNSDDLVVASKNAANEKSPVEAKAYSGETAEVEFVGPKINSETWEQDQSFKFGFKTSEQSRKEESDANGNVRGSYSFKNENGEDIEVKYTAGADTGFVVQNLDEVLAKSRPQESTHIASKSDEIAIESQPLSNNVNSIKENAIPLLSAEEPSGLYGAPSAPLPAYNEPPPSAVSQLETVYDEPSEDLPSYNEQEPAIPAPLTAANPVMIMNPNYKFAYNNDDSSRTEDANPDTGIITGQYSYTNPEGNEIEVKYRAGAGIGFVIDNQEELDAVLLKATEDGADAVLLKATEGGAEVSTLTSQDSAPASHSGNGENTIQLQSLYDAPTESLPSYNEDILPIKNEESLPSYNKDSLPINKKQVLPSNNEVSLTSFNEQSLLSSTDNALGASSHNTADTGIVQDASFKFSVEEETQSFQEESDADGERTGSYSYTSPDGELIVVRYRAGRDGFVILNPEDVLPKAPVHNF